MALVPTWFPRGAWPGTANCPTAGAGLPASITKLTVSMWGGPQNSLALLSADTGVIGPGGFTLDFSIGGGGPLPTPGSNTAIVTLNVKNHAPGYPTSDQPANNLQYIKQVDACYNQTVGGIQYASSLYGHYIASIDFIAKTFVCYYNDQLLVYSSGAFAATGTAVYNGSALWNLRASGSYGDVWVAPVALDLSILANRRQFINADFSPVQLPTSGQITANTGLITPPIYLRATPWQLNTDANGTPSIGDPTHPISEFLANGGSGPDWAGTVNGDTNTTGALYAPQPPATNAGMGYSANDFKNIMISGNGWGPPKTISSTTDLGLPASFRYALFSIFFTPNGAPVGFFFGSTTGAGGLKVEVDPNVTFRVRITAYDGTNVIGTGTAPFSYSGWNPGTCGCHVLVSIDSVGHIAQCYINGLAKTVTMTWNSAVPMTKPPGMKLEAADGTDECIGDLYYTDTVSFYDLDLMVVSRPWPLHVLGFVTPANFWSASTPVDAKPLGSNGQGPTNYTPRVYLRAPHTATTGTEWVANLGTGGAFSPVPPLCAPRPPPPVINLDIDDIVCIEEAEAAVVTLPNTNLISLRWSDDRAHSFGNPVSQGFGEIGEYLTSLQWQRLGFARSRVFEISWSVPCRAALKGCWIDATPGQS